MSTMPRLPLLTASLFTALLVAGSAHAGAPKAKPGAASPSALPSAAKSLGQLSKSELKAKVSSSALPKMSQLFEPLEGLEITEMPGDQTHNGFDLVYRGVKATAFDDADGSDEVAVWIATVRPTANGYTKSVHKVATPQKLTAVVDGSNEGATTLFHGDRTPMLLLGAVIEDDDGNAAQRIAELDVLLTQAIQAATIMREPDDDPLDVLHGTLELGKLMLGADPGRPDLAIRPIRPTDWDRLWDLEPTRDGERPQFKAGATKTKTAVTKAQNASFIYKVALSGKVGSGRYALRFDVPAAPGRKPRQVVKVNLDQLLVVTPPNDLSALGKEYFVRVCIAQSANVGLNIDQPATQSCITQNLMWAHSDASWEDVKIYRRMRQGKVAINVFSWWTHDSGSEFKFLDLDQGKLGFVKLEAQVGASSGKLEWELTGDGEGGQAYSFTCFSCGFPSGGAIGKVKMDVRW